MKVNGKKSTIENDNGLVSIKGTGKRTIVGGFIYVSNYDDSIFIN